MLTARDAVEARVEGLDTGADDYLVKPFDRQELLARLRALLRRRPPRGAAPLVVGDLMLNPDTHEVTRGERAVDLTQREFELLEYLMRNERIVVSRQRLLDEVWGYDPFSMTNTIEVFVSNLRRKLEAGGEPRLLHTIRGAGYVFARLRPRLGRLFIAYRRVPDPLAARGRIGRADVRHPARLRGRSSGVLTTRQIRSDFDDQSRAPPTTCASGSSCDPRERPACQGPDLDVYGSAEDAAIRVVDESTVTCSCKDHGRARASACRIGATTDIARLPRRVARDPRRRRSVRPYWSTRRPLSDVATRPPRGCASS